MSAAPFFINARENNDSASDSPRRGISLHHLAILWRHLHYLAFIPLILFWTTLPLAAKSNTCRIIPGNDLKWVVPTPKGTFTIDGQLDEWDFSRPAIVGNAAAIDEKGLGWKDPVPQGDADLSGLVQVAWDSLNVYIAAKITDDDLAQTTAQNEWGSPWDHDSLVASFCPPNWLTQGPRSLGKTSPILYFGLSYYSPSSGPRPLPGGARYFASRTATGYQIEASIPFDLLGFSPLAGDRIPFMVVFSDRDPNKAAHLFFDQYGLPTRGFGIIEDQIAQMRLLNAAGWGGELITTEPTVKQGTSISFLGTVDVPTRPITLAGVELISLDDPEVILRAPLAEQLNPGRRYHINGRFLIPPNTAPGPYGIRLVGGNSPPGPATPLLVTRSSNVTTEPRISTSRARFGEDATRYYDSPGAPENLPELELPTPLSYLNYIYQGSRFSASSLSAGPDRYIYGPQHALPALAHYVALKRWQQNPAANPVPPWLAAYDPDKLAAGIKQTLRFFDRAVREWIAAKGYHEFFIHEPGMLCLIRKFFQHYGAWSPADEQAFKKLLLLMGRTVYPVGKPLHFYRGPHHRPMGEANLKRLVVALYPESPEAKEWKRYTQLQWHDFWDYRDSPMNDINYFHNQVWHIVMAGVLLDKKEVFTDAEMRSFWDRLIHTTTPDGAIVPFGPADGWNSHAGMRMGILEIVAAYSGDGRYRFAAQRIFSQILYQENVNRINHSLGGRAQLGAALAYLLGDFSLDPVQPDQGSVVLTHKEVLSIAGKEVATQFLKGLDPDPTKGHVDCAALCTHKVLPFKLVLRSGWNPGDLFMLVDLFPRSAGPMNVGGVLGMVRYNSVLTYGIASKQTTEWHNMFAIDDLMGTTEKVLNDNPHTIDPFYMDVAVSSLDDSKNATYAAIDVTNLNGFPMTYQREFFFIKNRFCLVRDTAVFNKNFLGRIGPNWVTQNIGRQVGDHFANTYITAPVCHKLRLNQNPMDLMVYHAPHKERNLTITDAALQDQRRVHLPYTLGYEFSGFVQANKKYTFTHLLLPLVPHRKQIWTTDPSAATLDDQLGPYAAEGVEVLLDNEDQSVWRIRTGEQREEWIVLNAGGDPISVTHLQTDARQVYLDVRKGAVIGATIQEGTRLELRGNSLFTHSTRRNFEK